MKKLLALLISTIMVLTLTACGTAEVKSTGTTTAAASATGETSAKEGSAANTTASNGKVVAYFVGIMQGGAAWGQAEAGFNAACKELGWEGHYVAPATPNDTVNMVELSETAITNKANVLIGTYYSVDVFGDVVKKAFDNGTYVATTNCSLGEGYQNFWIGTVPEGMGISQAKALLKIVGDKACTVVYMQTLASTETQNQQYDAFCKYLKDYSNVTVFGQEYCDSNEVKAADTINSLVKANPQINACVCADGNGALGVANYVDESGNKDSFASIGIDDSATILGYVKSGALDCTIAQDFYKMGYQSCMMTKQIMDGKTVDFANDSGTVTVFAADVDSYASEKGIAMN